MLPNCIVLATDGSEDALLAARAAASISAGTGARLHLVRAWRLAPSRYPSTEMVDRIEAGLRKAMEGEARRLEEMGADVAGSHLRMGPPADAVLDVAEEVGAGLVLVGARGLGPVGRILLGSVSEGVVHHARCPVLVTRGGAWPPEHLVIADDGSEAARSAGDLAAALGKVLGVGRCLIVRAYPEMPVVDAENRASDARLVDDELRRGERELSGRAKEIDDTLGIRPETRVSVGNPATCVLEAAGEHDPPERTLTAVGSRGLGPLGRARLGSVSTKLVRAAPGPILVCPPAAETGG